MNEIIKARFKEKIVKHFKEKFPESVNTYDCKKDMYSILTMMDIVMDSIKVDDLVPEFCSAKHRVLDELLFGAADVLKEGKREFPIVSGEGKFIMTVEFKQTQP